MPKKKTNASATLSDAVDVLLLDLIKNGREVLDTNGLPVLDENGKPVRRQASAADIAQAINRLKQTGIASAGLPGTALDNLRKAVEDGSLKFPELTDAPDPATGTHG